MKRFVCDDINRILRSKSKRPRISSPVRVISCFSPRQTEPRVPLQDISTSSRMNRNGSPGQSVFLRGHNVEGLNERCLPTTPLSKKRHSEIRHEKRTSDFSDILVSNHSRSIKTKSKQKEYLICHLNPIMDKLEKNGKPLNIKNRIVLRRFNNRVNEIDGRKVLFSFQF